MTTGDLKRLDTILGIILVLAVALAGYHFSAVFKEFEGERDVASETERQLQGQIADLERDLNEADKHNNELAEALAEERNRQNLLAREVRDLVGTVGDLEKLRRIDPELLQKYSKVYFLNEHYVPPRLVAIDQKYTHASGRTQQIHADVWPHLRRLLTDAESDGVDLRIISAFRSFGEQAAIKTGYVFTYGAGTANQFSAEQGYSEHQLGTTVDFTTPSVGAQFSRFAQDPAYRWLTENAHRYGFILSYPPGNTYYQYESWHWRFVGRDLARYLYRNDKYFYDLDQREINEYLLTFFD